MDYYKVINGNQFVGVATTADLRRYQEKHNTILLSDAQNAQYVYLKDKYYRDTWFAPVTTETIKYIPVIITAIKKSEYDQLKSAIDGGDVIEVSENIKPETTTTTPKQDTTVERTVEVSPMDRIETLEKQQKELQDKLNELMKTKEG